MAKEVIYVADDLGLSSEINDAILHAHRSGQLTAAALMMAQPATDEAIALARENPSLQIGWHVHLNDSEPATTDRWPWGDSPARAGLALGLSQRARELMRLELKRQWQLFRRSGLECRFVNSHHHLHAHPSVFRALQETLGPGYRGWIRLGRPRAFDSPSSAAATLRLARFFLERGRRLSPWRTPDTLWGIDRTFRMKANEVRAAVDSLPDGFHEFLFHPRSRTCADTQCLQQLNPS